jgi:hypothetical protein
VSTTLSLDDRFSRPEIPFLPRKRSSRTWNGAEDSSGNPRCFLNSGEMISSTAMLRISRQRLSPRFDFFNPAVPLANGDEPVAPPLRGSYFYFARCSWAASNCGKRSVISNHGAFEPT